MNLLRNALIGGILVVIFLLFIRWNDFQAQQQEVEQQQQETLTSNVDVPSDLGVPAPVATTSGDIPSAPQASTQSVTPVAALQTAQLITIETDSLLVEIDSHGGDIVKVSLPKHLVKQDDPTNPFTLLRRTESNIFVAQSGLIGPNGTDTAAGRPTFQTNRNHYSLDNGQDSLVVDLTTQQNQVTITKRFTFERDSYLIKIEYLIDNQSDQPWVGTVYGQIKRDSHKPSSDMIGMQPYVGAAITTPDTNYKKLDFGDLAEKPYKVENQGGWVAMIQHYFVSAWIPDAEETNNYTLRKSQGKDIFLLGFTGELNTVAPGTQGVLKAQFYSGPKIIRNLEAISPYLDLTIDFSWLWFIAKPLYFALQFIQGFVGNWGIAIILLTVVIKIIFFWPSAVSYRSMAKMRKLQPLMADLKDKYGDDRQRMSQEMMKMYSREKVNPLGGCLPILLQMPVFIALYWVLMESVELRHSPFFLWIEDLSVKDPFFILPLIMGATMFIQQQLNPTPPDPMQAKIMKMMPIFFTFLFLLFPAGLVLYWVVNNTLSIIQQYVITKQIENEP